jgi:hypothetical protein
MGISKAYRGYIIEDVNGQYYIRNAPNFTNGVPFSPGPHGGWSVATHQVDILINHINRDNDRDSGKWQSRDSYDDNYVPSTKYEAPIYKVVDGVELTFFEYIFTHLVAIGIILLGVWVVYKILQPVIKPIFNAIVG